MEVRITKRRGRKYKVYFDDILYFECWTMREVRSRIIKLRDSKKS